VIVRAAFIELFDVREEADTDTVGVNEVDLLIDELEEELDEPPKMRLGILSDFRMLFFD